MPGPARYLDDVAKAMSIKFNGYMYQLKQAGEDVIVLSLGKAFFDIPLYPFDALPLPDLYHCSNSRGILGLRRKLAACYENRHHVPVDPETQLLVTAGSGIGLHACFMALLDPGATRW